MNDKVIMDMKQRLADNVPIQDILEIKTFIVDIDRQIEQIVEGKGENAFSYWHSSHTLIKSINDALENDESSLRLEAIICDIFNGFAHAAKSAQGFRSDVVRRMFSLKDTMINRIKNICREEGNKAYGYGKDKNGKSIFVVDIPETGQIVWHDQRIFSEQQQQYPFQVDDKNIDKTNMSFLRRAYEDLKQSEINERFGAHTAIVLQSYDVESMNENLQEHYAKRDEKRKFITGLQNLVSEPSIDELKIESNKTIADHSVSLPGENI